MSPSTHAVLTEVVDRYDESGEPVTAAALAESLDAREAALAESLASLREFDLVVVADGGYRPTVTARELLALGIDVDDAVVVDVVEEP